MFPFSHSKLYTTALLHMKQASEKEERFNIFLPEVPAHPGGGLSPYRPTPPRTRHEQLFHRHRPALKTICILLAATCLGRAGLDRRKVIGRQVPAEETTLGIAGVGGGNGGPTPVFFPGEFHGQRSLAGYIPWGCKEQDMTEQLTPSRMDRPR